ncbi:tetratricopeptide repeat protein [Zunongwangia pacifica]|uniref:Tetratricopeptide repeat protein n=1 Tax=Zunongwangia pacifica TaxID=2911062 RepID=A0A9X1ZW85_9FLAO|nr:tetratricopeptide repeat protein [Zunongwangia pacifica]MCL6220360.1 tetratricopeptide repeat protein [Zunongwangia pacifica]
MLVVLVMVGCVENPNVTEEVYLENPNAMRSWVVGLQRQLAVTTNTVTVNTAITSDNYYNNYTQYSKIFDRLQIDYYDTDVNNLQADIQELRAMAMYGLEVVLPADPVSTKEQEAYLYFCLGYADLLGGELFIGLPQNNYGEVESWEKLLQNAIVAFDEAMALETSAEMNRVYTLLQARAYYNLGDRENAVQLASQLIGQEVLYSVEFDGQNGVANEMQNATFDALPNRLAPLPRLDFLDPKYYSVGTPATDQKTVAIAKVEEAYLILAEANLGKGDLAAAQSNLVQLLQVVKNRPVVMIDDSGETRNGGKREDYPNQSVPVRFTKEGKYQEGYILNRQEGPIAAHTISGTKVTELDINSTSTIDDLLYLTYRLRQEIFISEGRRLSDLGIKFPVSQIEQLNNPNVSEEYTIPQIPSFLPAESMDDFSVAEDGSITIVEDLNRLIIQNKSLPEVVPFF